MKEYISKEYIYSILSPRLLDSRGAEHYAYDCIKQEIDYAPKSKIVYIGTTRWIPIQVPTGNEAFGFKEMMVDSFECSECGGTIDVSEEHFKFCPHCGKIMTKENDNGDA
jgi:DNA-directed RNA polymerase subunit RPC12/RpoP